MKHFFAIFLIIFMSACTSLPRYQPQTMFPQGQIQITPSINKDFSTKLHKFVELEFFNDNKEWVEINNFSLLGSDDTPHEILRDQQQIDEWVSLRQNEAVSETASGRKAASAVFAVLSVGLFVAELIQSEDNEGSESAAETSDDLAESALSAEERKYSKMNQALNQGQIAPTLRLPPGRHIKRWFIVNTPEDDLPKKLKLSFEAQGKISGQKLTKNIELIEEHRISKN